MENGGDGELHWYVYHGTISPESITATDVFREPTVAEKDFMTADNEGRLERVPDDVVARENGVSVEVARNMMVFCIKS